jgi:hypothetical protein
MTRIVVITGGYYSHSPPAIFTGVVDVVDEEVPLGASTTLGSFLS